MEILERNGLDVDFLGVIEEFVVSKESVSKVTDELSSLVDKNGFTGREVLKKLGELQRSSVIKTGLFKHFRELDEQVKSLSSVPSPEDQKIEVKDQSSSSDSEASLVNFEFSETQEKKIKDLLAKEEASFKQRLLNKERKWRDKISKGEEIKTQRLGLNAEQSAKVKEIKDKISNNIETIKSLKEENVKLKTELNEVRPKRTRKPLTSEQKEKMAAARRVYWEKKKAGKA
jgi:hypothetical protein